MDAMKTRHRRQRGTSLVEMAIVLPLLLLVLFGMIEYGWIFLKSQQLTNAARHGARIAVTPDATTAQVQTAIDSLMADADLDGSGYSITITPGDVSTPAVGEPIEVSISVPYANIGITNAPLILVPNTIGGRITMAKEGP